MRELRLLLLLAAGFGAAPALAEDLDGFWKIDDRPVWIEIRTEGELPTGKVQRNDTNPDTVGLELLKDLAAVTGESRTWGGQIFAARLGEYRDAEIALVEPGRMEISVKAGLMRRTIGWTRVEGVPK